jgi:pSer/pThr/pTyr-binding forkhead associated (FHA) protein
MDPSDFFLIHVAEAEREPGHRVQATPRGDERQPEGLPQGGYNVRLRWVEGMPAITDVGSVGRVLVNGAPIEPRVPFLIQAGDSISIGNVQLTWHAATEGEAAERQPAAVQTQASAIPARTPVQAAPTYSLVVKTADRTIQVSLTEAVMRIGRAPDNDIVIDDDRVSRYHARLVQRGDGYEIVDLGSANGLKIENERISRKSLVHGDVVWVSSAASLTYEVTQPTSAPGAMERMTGQPGGAQVPDATIVVPRKAVEPPAREAAAPGAVSAERAGDPGEDRAADATVVARRKRIEPAAREAPAPAPDHTERVPEPGEDRPPDATVVMPRKKVESPAPEPTERAAEPGEDRAPDATVVAPRPHVGPVTTPPEKQDATVMAPSGAGSAADTPATPGEGATILASGSGAETELMDMAEVLRQDPSLKIEMGTIIRDTSVPRLVLRLPNRTWEVQFTKERMTIGRDEDNDIPIPDPSISRHHAWIERRGDDFVISEAQSRNGIWLDKRRVTEHTLRDGDVLSLGRAKLVFKGGFTSDDLTLIGTPRIDGQPQRRPVVFVPGLGGSELWLGKERLWPEPKILISNPEVYSLPGDPRIEARHIVGDVVIVPNVIKQQQYSRLGDYLETGLGYTRGKDLLEFAYDWRQDIRLASQRLAETIERWGVRAPITIVAHSLGTLVTRYYVERLGGKKSVERIILMGGPHYGTPKGLSVILVGPGLLPFGMSDERLRHVLASFPSAYQILPIYPSVTDQHGNHVNVLKDDSWLPEHQRPFLRAARSFRRELGVLSSVPSVSIFGYGLKTIVRAKIHRRPDGQWGKVDFIEDMAGDLSVPSGSAVLKKSEIHPVFQEHGSLYVDDDVKMRLKVELTRSTTWQRRK